MMRSLGIRLERDKATAYSPNELPFFSFDIHELNAWAAATVGHGQPFDPDIIIFDRPTLASIWTGIDRPKIELHPIFNVEWLPLEVMRHVLIHEHIHRAIPPREVEPGTIKHHPPEFWEMERKLSPHGATAWRWMYLEWGDLLKRDVERECIWVKRGWKRIRKVQTEAHYNMFRGMGLEASPQRFTTWEEAVVQTNSRNTDDRLI